MRIRRIHRLCNAVALFVAAFCLVSCGQQKGVDALYSILPVPVNVERLSGSAESDDVSYVTASVPGAPENVADEAYILEIGQDGVKITSSGERGRIWAQRTLEQLRSFTRGENLPACRIVDWPQYPLRGFMHDSGRNFLEVEHVKGVIEALSRAKMNFFHWHFTEYYGWRLESRKYPQLQDSSAFYIRDVGKYYTQEEFCEVVEYAAERGVTVIPEFDIPGHALAFRRAFGFETMRDEGVQEILCDLIDELCSLVPASRMPYIHLGTDEVRRPEEYVPQGWMHPLVERVRANGRTVIGWMPGQLADMHGEPGIVGMKWGRKPAATNAPTPLIEASGMYIDTLDPMELLDLAASLRICDWDEQVGQALGGVVCAWHDDYAGGGVLTLRNQAVLPAISLFGDNFWRGRKDGAVNVRDLERRCMAQRDYVFADLPYPFHFVKQTQLHWKISLDDGTVICDDYNGATAFIWKFANAGEEGSEKPVPTSNSLSDRRTGTAFMETWVYSPKRQTVGAWIGFTDFCRDHGRAGRFPTPRLGEWSADGAQVFVNGTELPPPVWKKPGQMPGPDVPYLMYVHEIDEIPFVDEEYYMREPAEVALDKGWNHIRLVVPMPEPAKRHYPWVATFVPVSGTTDHPSEVEGLIFRSTPPETDGRSSDRFACVKPARNVILMIPDGTSTSILSLAKWYGRYLGDPDFELNVKDHVCGLMSSITSGGIIPGSAAAMSAIVTGMPHGAGSLSVYPQAHPGQDIVEVDPTRAYQPLATVLEAARLKKDKSIGLVATVMFHHATPAACVSHAISRDDTGKITRQMASGGVDVLFAGGLDAIDDKVRTILDENGVMLQENDIDGFRRYGGKGPVWSVFGDEEMDFEIDRDTLKAPSLAEMTSRAIELLSRDKDGFFLMVEGSKVDYAAHANDPNTTLTEFIAFDKAVGVALDYAAKDGNTVVVVVPDHGTSGMTAMKKGVKNYYKKGIDSVYVDMKNYKASYHKLAQILSECSKEDVRSLFKEWTGISLKDEELMRLLETAGKKENDYMKVSDSRNFESAIASILASHTNITFASGSHTSENVFLAVYHPDGDIPQGILSNRELNEYLCTVTGLKEPLSAVTEEYFVRHDVLLEDYAYELKDRQEEPELIIHGPSGDVVVHAWQNIVSTVKGKVRMPVPSVYMIESGLFYLPREILEIL